MAIQAITVEHDIGKIKVFLDELATKAIKKAVATSISRTFTQLKKEVAQDVAGRRLINPRSLPTREIKSRQYIRESSRLSQSMPIGEMFAQIDFRKKKPGLVHFWAKRINIRRKNHMGQPLYGVQVTVMGKTYALGRAFMPGSSGLRPIFARTTKQRFPIRVLRGPSFATMFEKLGLAPTLQESARARYAREFEHNFEFYLKQLTEKSSGKSG